MPDWLCPVCKSELCGNIEDGEFCRHCDYERVGNKELKEYKRKDNKNE